MSSTDTTPAIRRDRVREHRALYSTGTVQISGIARRLSLYALAIIFSVIFSIPFYWALVGSIKKINEILVVPPVWFPSVPQWQNYVQVFQMTPYLLWYQNTVVVSVSSAVGQVLSSSIVAYGFARFRFPGRNTLFMLVLSTLMLPPTVTMIPSFLLFKQLGWLNTWLPLIVPNWLGGGAFFIFLFRQFFLSIPQDLDEAASLDGANAMQIFWRILTPLCAPVWAAAAIISFLGSWSDFIGPLIYLNSQSKYTLSLGLEYFNTGGITGIPTGQPMQNFLMAASVMMTVPPIVLFFVGQRYFIRGVVMSGIRG
ncbi:MAG: carbohydrate ABC transporter permease [Chloroflexi bacterium]|nr:carbohydrate ABC transporter permease [Chloroflexota bacterium]